MRPESADSQFKWEDFKSKNNNVLSHNFGNMIHRVLKMINIKKNSIIPAFEVNLDKLRKEDTELLDNIKVILNEYVKKMEK